MLALGPGYPFRALFARSEVKTTGSGRCLASTRQSISQIASLVDACLAPP